MRLALVGAALVVTSAIRSGWAMERLDGLAMLGWLLVLLGVVFHVLVVEGGRQAVADIESVREDLT